MLSQNSQVVSLLSPAPTAFEAANLSQSQDHRDASHESETEERAHAQDEESLAKEREALKEDEFAEDKKLFFRPSDIALGSAEYDEKKAPLRGSIDLRYHYNVTRDANSLSSGGQTGSLGPTDISESPGSIHQASNKPIELIQLPPQFLWRHR
ncbi:hypothetical protein BDR22DRAFT_890756 [Usnea florida]